MRLPARTCLSLAVALALGLWAAGASQAPQHRATRLGHPDTRFADPLRTPEDLRALFRNEQLKPDVASILAQWGWRGNLEDLTRAAATAEIRPWTIPVGGRMPFMSAREGGKPVTLRDVEWAGKEPVDAYAFEFASQGRRYRCVTPKACSNFFLEELGPERPRVRLVLLKTAPPEVSVCDPFEMRLEVHNTGTAPLTQVRLTDPLPAGWQAVDGQTTLTVDVGSLAPGDAKAYRLRVRAATPGEYENVARATSAEGAQAEAKAAVRVRAPALALECRAPADLLVGQPLEVCLTVRNLGEVPDPRVTVGLPVPAGATLIRTTEGGTLSDGQVVWQVPDLAPQASRSLCAHFAVRQPVALTFDATARGTCAPPVQSRCASAVFGVAAILLEVVDLADPIQVGDPVTYDLTITNQGQVPGTGVRWVCTLPAEQEFISASGVTPVRAEQGRIEATPLAVLGPKAAASWRVLVRARAAGDVRFKIELTSDQFQVPIEEAESTTQY